MAANYNRRITLYINGKEIKNDIKSVNAEMRKLINEQQRMTIGSKEYIEQTAKIKYLKSIVDKHKQDISGVQKGWNMQKMSEGFNRYFGIITAGVASFAGIVMAGKKAIETFNQFEERVDNLSALTGLEGEQLQWLSDMAKKTSIDTVEGNIKIKQSADSIIDAYTKVGSQRPELLANKEALHAVTVDAIILSEAAKTDLEPAVAGLTMAMNQLGLQSDQSRRIINVFAAGSKAGSADIPYLTAATEKSGTTARLMGLSFEQLTGAIEAIAPSYSEASMAGNSFDKVLLKMKDKGIGVVNGQFDLIAAITELEKRYASGTTSADLFGVEHAKMGELLVLNKKDIIAYTAAVTGTNVAIEQATKNTNNNAASLAQAQNRAQIMRIELGEKLAPAMTMAVSSGAMAMKFLSIMIDFFEKNRIAIISVTAAILFYTASVKLVAIWEGRLNGVNIISLALSKTKLFLLNAQKASMILLAAAQALLTGNISRASAAMRLFNLVSGANPYILLATVLIGVGVAIAQYAKKLAAVTIAQKTLTEVNDKAKESMVDEKNKLDQLLLVARDEKLSKEARLKAIKEINEISPRYLGGITLETINTDAATDAVKKYIAQMELKAKLQAAQELYSETLKDQLKAEQDGSNKKLSIWQKTGAALEAYAKSGAGMLGETYKAEVAEREKGNLDQFNKDVKERKDTLQQIIIDSNRKIDAENTAGAVSSAQTDADKKAADDARIAAEKQRAADAKKAREDAQKAALEALDKKNAMEVAAIKRQHYQQKTSDAQFQADILAQELKYLDAKMNLFTKGSQEYEDAYVAKLEKIETEEKRINDLMLEAQKTLSEAKIDNLLDGIEKEKAIEENRWANELAALKKQLIAKKQLSAEEIAFNDTINKTIEEKTKSHNDKMNDLDRASGIQSKMDAALIAQAKAQGNEEKWAAETAVAQAAHAQQLADAKGNAVLIAQAERELKDKLIKIKQEELDAKHAITGAIIDLADSGFTALVEIAGKETALGKAMFLFQQAAAIAKVIFNTQIANSEAVAAFPLTAGMPWTGINTAVAGISIATILAQTIKEFAVGGFTQGEAIYKAGEAGEEWISPNWMLNHPVTGPIISNLERGRRNPATISAAAFSATQQPTFRSSSSSVSSAMGAQGSNSAQASSQAMNAAVLTDLRNLLADLSKNGVRAQINKWGVNGLDDAMNDISKFNTNIGKQ